MPPPPPQARFANSSGGARPRLASSGPLMAIRRLAGRAIAVDLFCRVLNHGPPRHRAHAVKRGKIAVSPCNMHDAKRRPASDFPAICRRAGLLVSASIIIESRSWLRVADGSCRRGWHNAYFLAAECLLRSRWLFFRGQSRTRGRRSSCGLAFGNPRVVCHGASGQLVRVGDFLDCGGSNPAFFLVL